jgi:tetratricopeptide (TPR) repeat protein
VTGDCSIRRLFGGLLLGMALSAPAMAHAADCTHAPLAELPLIPNDEGTPVVSLRIDGMPRNVLLDSGGFWSLIDPSIARDYPTHPSRVIGQLGLQGIPLTRAVTVPFIEIGGRTFRDVDFFLEPRGYTPTAATLGANWLGSLDVEIDPASGKAVFYPSSHCREDIGRWPHSELAVLPITVDPAQRLISVPLELDGKPIKALIDTGSSETFLSARAASDLFGIEAPETPTPEAGPDRVGRAREAYRRHFSTLRMGDVVFNNPWLVIAPVAGNNPDMILGMHDLGSLHLYFAYREGKLYASTVRGDAAARSGGIASVPAGGTIAMINVRDYLLTGEDALKHRDYDGAMAALDSAAHSDPGNADVYLERAQLFSLEGQHNRAMEDAARAVTLAPRNALGFVLRSELETLDGDADGALADAGRAVALEPNSETGYAARAEGYAAKGQWDLAMRDSDAAIRVAPDSATGYLSRSHLYQLTGDYAHALEDADRAVHVQPKSANALNARCWNGAILARLDMALDDCNAAVALRPYSAEILDSRAFVNLKAGNYDMALADYSAALAINPRLASSLYGRGLAREKKGDAAASRIDIATAQAIDPRIAQHFGK